MWNSPSNADSENIGSIWQVRNNNFPQHKNMSNELEAPISSPSYSYDENFSLIRPTDIGESFPKYFEHSKISKLEDSNEMLRKSQNNVSKTLHNRDIGISVKHDQNNINMYSSFKSSPNGFSNVNENPLQTYNLNQNSNQLFSEEFLNYLSMIN